MFSAFSPTQATTAQSYALPTHLETLTLARNADSTELGSGLSERVNWMINQKQNTATIRLDPPFLGKLDVQIKIADDATTVIFQTQHAQTRDLIESASVRLRDFLQESGYQNVNVDVSQRQDQQQARSQTSLGSDADQQDESYQDPDFDHQERDAVNYFIGDGIVDTFA
jgi:flagellar hook-length control protein FliK